MNDNKKKLSVVIPVYNEEAVIPELIKQLSIFTRSMQQYEWEIILVENGSADNSFNLLKKHIKQDKRFKILQLSRNFGCDGGIEAGMRYATGDALVIMMADLQEPLEVIKEFAKKWEQGYEIVYGVVKKRTAGITRNLASVLFYKLINTLTSNMFPENASDFRLIDKKVYETINAMPEQNKYLRGLVMWTGFKHTGVEFDRKERFAGKAKSDFLTVFRVAQNGIFSFSYLPLRFVSFLGVLLTFVSFGLIIFYLILYFLHGREAPGAATIIILQLFLFGILFFILGIISEYIARIYDEAKHRPTYIVKNRINL